MTPDTREAIRLIQSGLEALGHSPGAVDGLWGLRTARAMKALLAANGRPASMAPPGPLPWITEAKTALGRHEVRDRSWLMDWLKRDGRSLGDPSKNPWCGDFVETCIRIALPDEPLLGALGSNPYWARNWMLFGQPVRPVIGAVLVFERGSGGHVGFAIGQDDTHFHVLGGNQSDAVTIARIAKSRLLGARWPTTWPPRLQRLQTMKPGDLLITTTNEV
ncbi:MAG: TIGR02594 family protein [Rhodobacteraceae bacterium]|nr:TIGR02594 family protein [Paracoccaceae bacterium]